MNDTHDKERLEELLGVKTVRSIIAELGIEHDAPEVQAEVLDVIGAQVFTSVILEVLKVLPSTERPAFDAYMGTGDVLGVREFLRRHIPDADAFMRHAAMVAYEKIRTRAHMITEGVQE